MNLQTYLENYILLLDGAMGTMLQKSGLGVGESPEAFNLKNPEAVKNVHLAYLQAGSKMIITNTFGANGRKLRGFDAEEMAKRAVDIAKSVAEGFDAYVALDIGPTGELFEPLGALTFDEAYEAFSKQVTAGVSAGADAIYIETMTDLYEAKCAVLAAKENSGLPVFCTMSFEKNRRTFTGVDIPSMALTLQGLGVDCIGINCSVGPDEMAAMAEELMQWTHLPIIIKPNAGLPSIVNGQTVFNTSASAFAASLSGMLDRGVAVVGGCCGTTPEYIKLLSSHVQGRKPIRREPCGISAVCSASKTVVIDRVRIIGERINPTGKKHLQKAVRENDMDYIAEQAIEQVDAGADILDVNIGLPGIDEAAVLAEAIRSIQCVASTPLQIDSLKPEAIEAALRSYNGKAIVNSINGEDSVLQTLLPVVKKYGAAVIGLTLDANGIPPTAEGRVKIAEKIVSAAVAIGIPKHDIFIDCLTLTAGAEQATAYETLDAVRLVKERLGVKTVLGVSNISFGLPARAKLNLTFLTLALANGLDMPIINPNDTDMTDAIYCYHQLKNIDTGSSAYISRFKAATESVQHRRPSENNLSYYLENGLKDEIITVVKTLLTQHQPLAVLENFLIPSLDTVGQKYEKGSIFLPQLLNASEAAKAAFEAVRLHMPASVADTVPQILLATVKGDIHDIGKNIVKAVLENYGFNVIDLGKDIEAEVIAEQAVKQGVKLVGLSALMTTTVDNMTKAIEAIKKADAGITVMVGGAVMTESYACDIGADYYAKDAMSAVGIAKNVFRKR